MSAHARTQLSPQVRTALLSCVLVSGAAALTLHSALASGHHLFAAPLTAIAITATFFLAEQNLVNIEFRRQSHSLTFAGVPLIMGALLLPVHELVAARLVGSVVALLLQRISVEKVCYNTAAYCFEAAVVGTAAGVIVHGPGGIALASVIGIVAFIAVVDQLMSVLVLCVIRLHGGRLSRADVVGVLAPSAGLSVVASVFGVSLVLLIDRGPVGVLLSAVLIGIATLLYRMYANTVRQHQSLSMVHEFVTEGEGAETLEDVARHSLLRIRSVLRASAVELLLLETPTAGVHSPDPDQALLLKLGEDDLLSRTRVRLEHADWVRSRALHHRQPTLAVRGNDSAITAWLDFVHLHDAAVVPLQSGADVMGTVTVSDRLTDTATFTQDDVQLLQTLSSHLAVSIQSARLMETLLHQATHDALTGLVNRAQLSDRIRALGPAAKTCAVLLLDLDKFKDVNDVLGHEIGDQLLRVVADRLRDCLPPEATIARLGGDEYAVLLPGAGVDIARTESLARCIVAAVLDPVRFDDAVLTPEVSIGIALGSTVATDNLLRSADTAMYVAKASDDGVAVYHPGMDSGRAERLALAADLRLALDHAPEQFALYYQPKIDLKTQEVTSAEALVRWLHPTRGMVPPDRFIPLAETTGLIDKLTEHVLTTAMRDCAAWRARGHSVDVAVNLSSRNLANDSVIGYVTSALDVAGASPTWLILEMTETVIMQDPTRAARILNDLADRGIRISLDDFGTGYSSLAYLQKLPVNELKIDKSFVAGLTSSEVTNATALFRSVTALGGNLSLRIVAEGIETAAQLATVTELGCDTGQGYLISRPLPLRDFNEWLDAKRSALGTELRLVPTG